MENLIPSFVIYTKFDKLTPVQRMVFAVKSFFDQTDNEPGTWCICCINEQGLLKFREKMETQSGLCWCHAEMTDSANGMEIYIEFYNCDYPEGVLYSNQSPLNI
jgi:hypothetical protein